MEGVRSVVLLSLGALSGCLLLPPPLPPPPPPGDARAEVEDARVFCADDRAEVVDPDLEVVILQPLAQLGFDPVRALRDEVETRPEPQFHLGFRQPATVGQSLGPLDVVRQDKGEAFPSRPARPP